MNTYTKLHSGEWGVRINGAANVGDTVTVTTRAGATKTERIAKVIWTGNGVTLAAIATNAPRNGRVYDTEKFNGYGAPRGGFRAKGCGCDCDECSRGCRCERHCNCRGGNVFDC